MPLQNGNESAYHQRRAIEQALEIDGPAIIDCVVAQDELPNFPHIEVDQAKNYVVAKVKEAMLSFVDH
jgi:thiamine pyrophosphate-dependent acetolactate synthase large subunit-like protein